MIVTTLTILNKTSLTSLSINSSKVEFKMAQLDYSSSADEIETIWDQFSDPLVIDESYGQVEDLESLLFDVHGEIGSNLSDAEIMGGVFNLDSLDLLELLDDGESSPEPMDVPFCRVFMQFGPEAVYYQCDTCSLIFDSIESMFEHLQAEHFVVI